MVIDVTGRPERGHQCEAHGLGDEDPELGGGLEHRTTAPWRKIWDTDLVDVSFGSDLKDSLQIALHGHERPLKLVSNTGRPDGGAPASPTTTPRRSPPARAPAATGCSAWTSRCSSPPARRRPTRSRSTRGRRRRAGHEQRGGDAVAARQLAGGRELRRPGAVHGGRRRPRPGAGDPLLRGVRRHRRPERQRHPGAHERERGGLRPAAGWSVGNFRLYRASGDTTWTREETNNHVLKLAVHGLENPPLPTGPEVTIAAGPRR